MPLPTTFIRAFAVVTKMHFFSSIAKKSLIYRAIVVIILADGYFFKDFRNRQRLFA